jgi:radical SAM superfamily enzyme YgiQ (UPF0313 family)
MRAGYVVGKPALAAASIHTTVGLVEIGGLVWQRRPARQYQMFDGVLLLKPTLADGPVTELTYLPHAVGLLQAYAQKYAPVENTFSFLRPLHERMPVARAVTHLQDADVVGFSLYVWNERLSLQIAERLKETSPTTLIVFGGPQVPNDSEQFLRANPWIDIVCHGEGERTFLEILLHRQDRHWDAIASVSFLSSSGRFIRNSARPRLRDLDEIPSPFLTGVFDDLMRFQTNRQWLAAWETDRGCPFSCSFCDWGSATGSKLGRYSMARLMSEIDWFVDHNIHHIFICDANFGILQRDIDLAAALSDAYARRGSYVAVSVQNTKNHPERTEKIQRLFRQSGAVSFGASSSLQSISPAVLKAIRRENISTGAFERLHQFAAREGLEGYTDLILGLPGETLDSFADGVAQVIQNGQLNRIIFYHCALLPNAPMAEPNYRQEHGLQTTPVRMIESHEPLDRRDHEEVPEYIDLVVATSSMNREDWVRARVYANFVELLFFDRILHMVLVILGSGFNLNYRKLFESFLVADGERFPLVGAVRQLFENQARAVQNGAPQYIASPEWLNLWWPVDQYALISLARGEYLDAFYDECRTILTGIAGEHRQVGNASLIEDAIRLNRASFALPFRLRDELIALSHPIGDWYRSLINGHLMMAGSQPCNYLVKRSGIIWLSWDDWCEDVVRRVYFPKGYLYPFETASEAVCQLGAIARTASDNGGNFLIGAGPAVTAAR